MPNATAIVDHDATAHRVDARYTCSCDKLVAAGWTVECASCGRGLRVAS